MKRIFALLLATMLVFSCTACGKAESKSVNAEPKVSQMKAICELAVMECYYHNVAKYKEDLNPTWPWQPKVKHFWIEYSGVVKLGIDTSLVALEVEGTTITITIPQARVLDCNVDSATLTKDSFIVAKKSAPITAEDEIKAFAEAQKNLEEAAASDSALLSAAQQQTKDLLESYIFSIGRISEKELAVHWIYLDAYGNQIGTESSSAQTPHETTN